MTGSQEKNMDNLSSLGNNAGFNQRSTFSDELARLSDSRGVSPQMIIKEGTLLKWFGWISTTLSPPWKPRIVKLKPGIMIVSSTSGDERLIPLVNRPNVITSDPARQQWIVDDGVGKLLYLKLPMSDPSDSYSVLVIHFMFDFIHGTSRLCIPLFTLGGTKLWLKLVTIMSTQKNLFVLAIIHLIGFKLRLVEILVWRWIILRAAMMD
eukprot:GHVH01008312.1.p1 GENE.GHVH01008312.1~~GHVH01008312.1.p1  ORF type:complete len:208 (+),score=12.79 GHVH01008312.1:253-876(+)